MKDGGSHDGFADILDFPAENFDQSSLSLIFKSTRLYERFFQNPSGSVLERGKSQQLGKRRGEVDDANAAYLPPGSEPRTVQHHNRAHRWSLGVKAMVAVGFARSDQRARAGSS